MPYIKQDDRGKLLKQLNVGTLNYSLTRELISYVTVNGLSYQTINDVVGALESAKAEFQRRVAGPYEDTKIRENGDVYPETLLSRPRTIPVVNPWTYDGHGNTATRRSEYGDKQVWSPAESAWVTVE